jgi:hypothetical protein
MNRAIVSDSLWLFSGNARYNHAFFLAVGLECRSGDGQGPNGKEVSVVRARAFELGK